MSVLVDSNVVSATTWPGFAGVTYGIPLADVLLSGVLEQALVVRNAVLAVDEAVEKWCQ